MQFWLELFSIVAAVALVVQVVILTALLFQVKRIDTAAVRVTATISGVNYAGVSTNWTWSAIETNYAYHRFDSFDDVLERFKTIVEHGKPKKRRTAELARKDLFLRG